MRDLLKPVREALLNNWGLKLLSALLATMCIFAIRGAINFEVPYNIPIEVEVDRGVAILDEEPSSVDVTFRGSQESLRYLDQRQIRAVVRAVGSDPRGSERVPIGPENIEGATGVRAVNVRPSGVTLTFDHESVKLVPVAPPRTIGKPMVGTVKLEYEPQSARIRGPKRRLDEIASVATEPIDVDGRVGSFTKTVRILSPDDKRITEIEPPEVTVHVNIITTVITRVLTNVTVYALAPAEESTEARFDPPVVNVNLSGRAEDLDALAPDSVSVFVNCADLHAAVNYELPVLIRLPPGTEATAKAEPPTVKTVFMKR